MSIPLRCLSRIALFATAPLLVSGAALAREVRCDVPMADWQPREAVQALVETQGLTVRRIKIDDGCYEVHARDTEGREIELKLDPATLAVVESELEDGHRHGQKDPH